MSTLFTKMRRFSRSSSIRNSQVPQSPPTSFTKPNSGAKFNSNSIATTSTASRPHQDVGIDGFTVIGPSGGSVANESRPISSATDASFDFANHPGTNGTTGSVGGAGGAKMSQRPMSGSLSASIGGLSRTDQIVLKHFWDGKYLENRSKDLHYLKFPHFPQFPSHEDLLPYCEIYHLVKTSPGANIINLGSSDGVYIGFELQTGSQLHIDLDDDWFHSTSAPTISHHRASFRPYTSLLSDPESDAVVRSWPKPLTIEFLEEVYQGWMSDLMAVCWDAVEVGELSGNGRTGDAGHGGTGRPSHGQQPAAEMGVGSGEILSGHGGHGLGVAQGGGGSRRGNGSSLVGVDDGYVSERSVGRGPSR